MKPIFQQCTNYYTGEKLFLNLAMAVSIVPTTYRSGDKQAHAIVTMPNAGGEEQMFYVSETYDFLVGTLLALRSIAADDTPTLRDQFAMSALAAMIGHEGKDGPARGKAGVPLLCGYAYEWADAMLAERGKR